VRPLLLVLLLVASSWGAQSQPAPSERSAESVVRTVLSRAPDQMYTSWDAKELNKLGDASAVALTKLLGGRSHFTPEEVTQVLLILRLSFSEPRMIEADSDAQPRTALFVLNYLGELPLPSELKEKVAAARIEIERARNAKRESLKQP
jgi:hypothetical protein